MKLLIIKCLSLFTLVLLPLHPASATENILTMSTTTSTQASGLLDILVPEFKKDTGITLKVIAKGTGAAIRDGINGNVDLIFVHAKEREEQFVAQGYGTKRYEVMYNDFLIIGPKSDPARISELKDPAAALAAIANTQARFISRGDDSGTHIKERELWRNSGTPLDNREQTVIKNGEKKIIHFLIPSQAEHWYISIGQGMGKTTTFADEKQAYTLIDRGTFIKYKYGKTPAIDLTPLCEGDSTLTNPYGVVPVNPAKHTGINHKGAKIFAEWITSKKGQKLIDNYRLAGKQLFYPDAK
ncbi:MAG: substrate-binding domain-containing protein [Desulfobulbaceae bacterium]|nr:substrate-binding domain-containing protein [Desulfobulbaceae bacterium]